MDKEYITVTYKISTVRKWLKLYLFLILPLWFLITAFCVWVWSFNILTIISLAGFGYSLYRYLSLRKLLRRSINYGQS